MKSFILIFKNNWRNVKKLKTVFILLFLIIIFFSTVFSLFWEFNRQFKSNINAFNLSVDNDDFIDESTDIKNDSINAFCTGFTEIYDNEQKTKRRTPILSFGGPNGCFQPIQFEDVRFTYVLSSEYDKQNNKFRVLRIENLKLSESTFKINDKSIFYQKSIHGLLVKKYAKTKDISLLNSMRWLEKTFLPNYRKFYQLKLQAYLNQKLKQNPVYTSFDATSETTISTILKDLVQYQPLLANVTLKYDKSSFQNINTNLISFKNRLQNFQKNPDQNILQTNFNFYYKNFIESIVAFLNESTLDNTNVKTKFLSILKEPTFDWKKFDPILNNQNFLKSDATKISIVDKQNAIYLVKLIDSIIQNKNDFIKNNQSISNYQKVIQDLLIQPNDIIFNLRQFFIHSFPTFELYFAIKTAFESKKYGPDHINNLKIFNYENQTIGQLWTKKNFSFSKTQTNIILRLISLMQSKYEAIVRFGNFQNNQKELIDLEKKLFGNQNESTKILATKEATKKDILIRSFFALLSKKIQSFKNKFVKYENFYGIETNDILSNEKQKFYSQLTNGFQLNNDFFAKITSTDKQKEYINEIIWFIDTVNQLIQKIVIRGLSKTNDRNWIANKLNVESVEDLDAVINKFNDLIDPHKPRYDKWDFLKKWTTFFFLNQLINSNLREQATSTTNKLEWNKLLDSPFFQKYFIYFYNGLHTLKESDYLEFQTSFAELKTNLFQQENDLLTKNIDQVPASKSTEKFKFETNDTEDIVYNKNFSTFISEFKNGNFAEIIKQKPGFLLSVLLYWMYPETLDNPKETTHIKFDANRDYLGIVFSLITYLTNVIKNIPTTNPIQKLAGNYVALKKYLFDNYENWYSLYALLNFRIKEIKNIVFKINQSYPTNFLDQFKTVELIGKDLNFKYKKFTIPPVFKHWFLKFGNGNSLNGNHKISLEPQAKQKFVDLLLKNNQLELFEKSWTLFDPSLPEQELFSQSIVTQPFFTKKINLFKTLLPQYIEWFKASLPTEELKNSFIIKNSIYPNPMLIKGFDSIQQFNGLRVSNIKTDFMTPFFFIKFSKEPKINVEKIINETNQKLNEYVRNTFWKSKAGQENIFDLRNWKWEKFFYKLIKDKYPPYRDHFLEETIDTKNELKSRKFIKIYGTALDIDVSFLSYIFFQDKKTNRSTLIIAKKPDLKVVLNEGYQSKKLNEVIISPLFAAANNIKIGDKMSIFNINDFVITGFGTTKQFAYPALNFINLIPQPNDNIIIIHPTMIRTLLRRLNETLNSGFFVKKDFVFYSVKSSDNKTEKYNEYYAYNASELKTNQPAQTKLPDNYTEFSEVLFPARRDLFKKYKVIDEEFTHYFKRPIRIPFKFNNLVPNVIYKTVFYVFLYVIGILFLISVFAIWHLLGKKIEINRWQMGILKAFGFSNFFLLTSLLSFIIFLIVGVFIGWTIGTILQKPFFGLFSDKLIFKFNYFYFNHISFYICLAFVILFTIFAIIIYNLFRFRHQSPPVLLNRSLILERGKVFSKIPMLVKRLIVHPFWRLNYIFFDTVGKKIIVLFFIVLLISINFITVVFFTSGFYKTKEFWNQSNEQKWQFYYNSPIKGNPLSRYNYYVNRGAQTIWDDKKNSNVPTTDLSADVYLHDGEKFTYQKLTISEVLGYFRVLQNKVINYNKINSLLNQNEKSQSITNLKSNVCLIIKNIFLDDKLDKLDCLSNIINRAIPFIVFPDPAKEKITKEHFPIAFNSIAFNPEKDELFTVLKAKMSNQKDIRQFDIFGFDSKSKIFKLQSKANLKRFFDTETNPQQKTIPIIVNRFFEDKFKKKIGDKFQISIEHPQLIFKPKTESKYEVKDSDWVYYEKDENGKITKTLVQNLPYDLQFYQGRYLLNSNLDPKDPDKYRIKIENFDNKNLEILEYFDSISKSWKGYFPYYKTQRNSQVKFLKYINVDNIGLKIKNNFWFPFRYTKESEGQLKKINLFYNWVNSEQIYSETKTIGLKNPANQLYEFEIIDIHPSIDKAKLFLPQAFLNYQVWGDASKTNNFAAPFNNPALFFNARSTTNKELYNAIFNFSISNQVGFLDLNTITLHRRSLVDNYKSYLENEYKIAFFRFAFEIIWILILFNLITLITLFGLMVKIIFDIFRKKTLLLRILGYKIWEIALQVFLIMFLPILISFIIASVVAKEIFDLLIEFLSTNYQVYIFYISDPWIFFACFSVFLIFWLLLFFSYFHSIKKAKIENLIKED